MTFPGTEHPQPLAYWQADDGSWRYAWPGQIAGSPTTADRTGRTGQRAPLQPRPAVAGIYVMGIVSLLYGMALLSGLVIHLPKLLGDLFALRPGRNLKQLWQDAHNVVGVLSLPFHLMFAVTGALLCLVFVQMALLNPLIYDGNAAGSTDCDGHRAGAQCQWHSSAAGQPARAACAREVARAGRGQLRTGLSEAGQWRRCQRDDRDHRRGQWHARPAWCRGIGRRHRQSARVAAAGPARRQPRHAQRRLRVALRRIRQWRGGLAVLPAGLGGAFLFYSGNLLWIESRRKRRQPQQPRAGVNMARATVGVCIGLCVAISIAFGTALVLERLAPSAVDHGIRWACFGSWAACALWAALPPGAGGTRTVVGGGGQYRAGAGTARRTQW